jgi:hypothetical protein
MFPLRRETTRAAKHNKEDDNLLYSPFQLITISHNQIYHHESMFRFFSPVSSCTLASIRDDHPLRWQSIKGASREGVA